VLDLCEPKPYLAHQAMFDASFPHGWHYYMRACDVAELSDEVIDVTVDHSLQITSPLTAFPIWQMGGAVGRVGEEETAFGTRDAAHTFNITAMTCGTDGFDAERDWRGACGQPSPRTRRASTSTSSWKRARSGSSKPTARRGTSGCRR